MKKFLLFFIILIIFINNYCFGATKEQFYKAINKNYDISINQDDTVHYHLRQNIVEKTKEFIDTHDISEDTYDKIIDCINEAVNIVRKYGTTDITKFSSEDIDRLLELVIISCNYVNVDFEEELNKELNSQNQIEEKDEAILNQYSEELNLIPTDNSGEPVFIEYISGEPSESGSKEYEIISNIQKVNTGNTNNKSSTIINNVVLKQNDKFVKILIIGYSVSIILVLLFVHIINFIRKKKFNKILKGLLITFFVILIIIIILLVVLSIIYSKELKYIIEIYYLLGGL